jgi:branched-chain amino acid transport system ATP-binding protein
MPAGQEVVTAAPILETRELTRRFGGFVAVDNVSVRVAEGSIHALIGPNGAGKTTFFNLLTKVLPPSSGSITYDGRDITGQSPAAVARQGLVRSFQISSIFPSLTALENVGVALQRQRGKSFDFWRSEQALDQYEDRAFDLLGKLGLADHAHRQAGALPYGAKRALELATTLALDPKMLLLDEPTAGMGHEEVDRIAQLIRTVAVGRTVLLVEHNLSIVSSLADTITVLARGKVLAEGDYPTVSNDPRIVEAYIGRSHRRND